MKKRMLAVLLLLAMVLTLCACGRKTKAVEETPAPAPVETPEPTPDPAEKIAAAAALFNAGDYSAALTELKTLEALGDPQVAWLLGKSFYEGLGTRTDGARAAEYLQRAASDGVAAARFLLADAADNGSGVRRDKDEASRAYVKFAALADELQPAAPGYGSAMVGLTQCYFRGLGVEKNQKFALDSAKKAADAEGLTPFDLMTLAAFFDSADTIKITANADAAAAAAGEKPEDARKIDAAKARALYTKAFDGIRSLAEAGNLRAQKLLGDFYFDGLGSTERDYEKALELYTKAGEAGYAPAQARVGYMYQNAMGVPADYDLAMEWNNRAAEQGNPQGQEQIGDLYREGLGVTLSLDEASRWYAKAKDGGSERAAAMLDETDIGWAYGGHGAHA